MDISIVRDRDSDEVASLPAVIEVDGPSHYLKDVGNTTRNLNGRTKWKTRLLENQGFDVVHVPYFEWNLLKGTEEKQKYLRKLLRRK